MPTLTETPFEGSAFVTEELVPSRLGRFAVLRELGAGGMGVVYAGYDERLDRKVAIKLLHASATGDSLGRARLVREAQAMAKVAHPNVAHVYEVAQQEERVYVVMQFIDGVDLRAWRERDAPSWHAAAQAYLQAGRGLAAAHAAGLVHRDFKPSNVMIDKTGHVRVLDFGIARAVDDVASSVREEDLSAADMDALRTQTGALVGTPAYLPPEVLRGSRADERSDQFSFCVSMFETIYGRRPFGNGKTADLIVALLDGQPPRKPEGNVPGWVFRVLSRGLRSQPSERYDSMTSLLAAIERGLRGGRTWVTLAALGGLAAVGGFAAALGNGSADPCPIDRGALGGAWGDERRAAVEASVTSLSASFADEAWIGLEHRADAYADQWVQGMREACEATRVQGVQSEQAFDRRAACLSELRRKFDALTHVLTEADFTMLKQLDELLGQLAPVQSCENPARSVEDPVPVGEEDAVEDIRNELAKARAISSAGRRLEGKALALQQIERAEAIDMPSLQGQAAHVAAGLVRDAGELDEALLLYRRAYFGFVSQTDMFYAVVSAAEIADLHARRAELGAGEEWIRHAESALASLSDPPAALRIALGYARSVIHQGRGNLQEAEVLLEEAVALADANGMSALRGRQLLADVYMWRGSWAKAIELYETGVAGCAQRVGADHPQCLFREGNLAFGLLKKGDIERARTLFDDVVRRARISLSEDGAAMETLLNNAAGTYERVGLYDTAQELFREVYAARKARLGPDHPLTAHPLNNLGNVFVSREDWDQAETHFSEALAILEKAQGPTHFHVSFPLHGLGLVARARGDVEAEIGLFRRVAEIREAADASPESRAAAWLELANASSKLPGREDEARRAAESGLAALEAAAGEEGEDLDTIRGELAGWFEAHPQASP